jgi:hypothetical protein
MIHKPHWMLTFSVCGFLTVFLLVGCFRVRTGCGTILYQAKTPEAVQALRSRIEPLRTALRSDARFIEVTNRRTLEFIGATNTEFVECRIGYDRDMDFADQQAILAANTTSTFGFVKQVRDLRQVLNQAIGSNALNQLTVSFESNWMDVR